MSSEALRFSMGNMALQTASSSFKTPKFASRLTVRSPSVPNFQESSYRKNNTSEPLLVKSHDIGSQLYKNGGHSRNASDGTGSKLNPAIEHDDSGMSLIDLYGDEAGSHKTTDKENHDGEYDVDSDDEDVGRDHMEYTNEVFNESLSNIASNTNTIKFDRYGFKKQSNFISQEQYESWWTEYSEYCIRRKHKWITLLEKSGLPLQNDAPSCFPPKSEKMKRYVRKGMPAEWRGNAWWYFARGQEMLDENKDIYTNLLEKMGDLEKEEQRNKIYDLDVIERDLNRTFPDNIHFQREQFQNSEPPMIKSLRRVLVAFSMYNPKIGYCQSMNFLAGLLLLFMEEEKAFWLLVIITSKFLPGVHNINLEGVNVDQGVLMLCLKEYLPEVWEFLDRSDKENKTHNSRNSFAHHHFTANPHIAKNEFLFKLPPITLCTASWFMSCFITNLPIETTLRMWDCMFYEGSHFLFKASLSIFKLSEPELMKNKQPNRAYSLTNNNKSLKFDRLNQDDHDMEIFQVIQSFPKKLIDPNEIFEKVIFKRRINLNRLDQQEIDRCRQYVASQRAKHKHFNDAVKNNNHGIRTVTEQIQKSAYFADQDEVSSNNDIISRETINDALSSEVYGFKKVFAGVHWNNGIKERVKQMRKRKEKDEYIQ